MSNNATKGEIGAHWDVHAKNGKHKIVVPDGKEYKQKANQTMLVCKAVWFYSYVDEYAFFKWIESIRCIENFSMINDALYLDIVDLGVPDEDLHELIALFHRYKIDMKQLAIFLNDNNRSWFYENKKAFWHKKVFGAKG